MISHQLRRILGGLLVLVLIFIVFTIYWMANDEHRTEQLHILNDNNSNKQHLSHTELPKVSLTPNLTRELNEISRPQIPWYFKDGTILPIEAKVDPKTGKRISRLWPEEDKNNDRVTNQLMFVPPNYRYDDEPMKTILLYNGVNAWNVKYEQEEFLYKKCPVNRCAITTDINKTSEVDAILFRDRYLPFQNFKKSAKQVWIMYFLESPKHTDRVPDNDLINWTATYRYDSDIVTPYERWAYYNSLVTQVQQLDRNYAEHKTKQVAWFVSNCNTNNKRLQYAKELAKYIPVDIYGKCGTLKCPRSRSDECFQMLNDDYKFYLAFENSNCVDYITEKFFVNGLRNNVLPIVMGGRREDYLRMAPDRSYVHVDDFESPRKLAEYLHRLDADDALYNEYFRWKGTGEFIDTRFFCRLCALLHDDAAPIKNYGDFERWWSGPSVCKNVTFDFGTADSSVNQWFSV